MKPPDLFFIASDCETTSEIIVKTNGMYFLYRENEPVIALSPVDKDQTVLLLEQSIDQAENLI
jgi:hypothetical protein